MASLPSFRRSQRGFPPPTISPHTSSLLSMNKQQPRHGGGGPITSSSEDDDDAPPAMTTTSSTVLVRFVATTSTGEDDDRAPQLGDDEDNLLETENDESRSTKKRKTAEAKNRTSETTISTAIDIAVDATCIHLDNILNSVLENGDKVPYAFYLSATTPNADNNNDSDDRETGKTRDLREITGSLREAMEELKMSSETVVEIAYEPLALFTVSPITRCSNSLPGHTEAILHVTYSPDGKRLASGGGDATVRFWDVSTNTPKHVCLGHKDHVLCTAWSPLGDRFASGDRRGEIRIWDPVSGKDVMGGKPLVGHTKWITSLAWEPAHRLSNREGGFSRLLSGSKDRTARIWNPKTGRCDATLTHHTDSVESVVWGGEGLIYTASRDRTICCWFEDAKTGGGFKIARVLTGHAHRINSLSISSAYLNRTGPFYDLIEDEMRGVDPNVTGNLVEIAKRKYDATRKKVSAFGDAVPFERLVSCSDDFTLIMWYPTQDKKPIARMTGHVQPVTHLCFSPDGRFLASASFDKKVKLWDGRTGSFLATLSGHVGCVYQVCFSPDSRMLVSASKDSTLKLWEVRDGARKAKFTLSGHFDEVYALDWSPDGTSLASGGKDRLLKIWKN